MNRIDRAFAELRSRGRKALIGYLTGGYPSFRALDRAADELVAAGVDLLEVGIPFSDPIADGPTIQQASQKALEAGATPAKVLEWVSRFRRRSDRPVALMTYMNPVHRMGLAGFARRARKAGADGVIVPDLIIEEGAELERALSAEGLCLIYLVAPTTPPGRRSLIAARSRGFVYAVSVTGVTGARRALPRELGGFLADLRRRSPRPVAVGFGISTPEQARRAARFSDGVIVGSAFIKALGEGRSPGALARSLRRALDARGGRPHAR